MKILQMHADFIEYTPIEKEIASAEEAEKRSERQDDILVLFTAVEKGDNNETAKTAVFDAKKFLANLKLNRLMIYPFAHISQNLARPSDALPVLKAMVDEATLLGIETFRAPFGWNKALQIKVKGHPLAEMSRSYGGERDIQAEKVRVPPERTAAREMSEHEMLARLNKIDYVGLPENDHRIIGERQDLFSFYEPSPSMVYWHDKGLVLRNLLIEFIRREIRKRGYVEISTAALANVVLWKVSGHWEFYKDNMFLTKLGDEDYGLKPMNCPSTFLYYMSRSWSYRDLPLRVADFDTLFRKELSGVTSGLFRVKSFIQDDAHIFCSEDQIEGEIIALVDLMHTLYSVFKLPYTPKVSTMPDEHLGTKEQWDKAVEILISTLRSKGVVPVIKEKEGAFYGPKIDVDVKDSLGRDWQCATIQLDYQLPTRFKLSYVGQDGRDHTPVVIHRVIYGSLERFIAIMLEHFSGKLPVWLSPVQVRVIPVSDQSDNFAKITLAKLVAAGIRSDADLESGTMGSKIRTAQLQRIPYMLIVGEKEEKSDTLAVRERDGKVTYGVDFDSFVKIVREKESKYE
jgi:threonyl-tRNA synthetase